MGSVLPWKSAERGVFENLFFEFVDDLSRVEREDQGHEFLINVAKKYNLRHAAYLGINIPGLTEREPFGLVTYSNEWRQHYLRQSYVNVDPVVRLGLTNLLPLDWSTINRSDPRVRNFFGEAGDAGVGRQGLSFSIRGRNNELALFSITSDANEVEWRDLKRFYMRDFQVMAHYFHASVLRVTGAAQTDYSKKLSLRERECLQWAAAGKSTWETSVILGVSERSVKFYLDQARHKLDCLNKTHAVAKALSLGLVMPTC